MKTGDIIRTLRINSGMTQKDLSENLGVSMYTIRCWESGTKLPSAKSIADISNCFDVSADLLLGTKGTSEIYSDMILSKKEKELVDMYRSLDSFGKRAVQSICSIEKSRIHSASTLDNNTIIESCANRYIPKYISPAAAGISVPLGGEDFEMILVNESIPPDADFAVTIQGDSMAPYINDGDTVYVRRTETLDIGNVGIFCVDGCTYCKQYYIDEYGNLMLLSANPEYRDTNVTISKSSSSSVICYGKVILKDKIKIPSYVNSLDNQ